MTKLASVDVVVGVLFLAPESGRSAASCFPITAGTRCPNGRLRFSSARYGDRSPSAGTPTGEDDESIRLPDRRAVRRGVPSKPLARSVRADDRSWLGHPAQKSASRYLLRFGDRDRAPAGQRGRRVTIRWRRGSGLPTVHAASGQCRRSGRVDGVDAWSVVGCVAGGVGRSHRGSVHRCRRRIEKSTSTGRLCSRGWWGARPVAGAGGGSDHRRQHRVGRVGAGAAVNPGRRPRPASESSMAR